MGLGFDPLIHPFVLVAGAVLLFVLTVWLYRRWRRVLAPGYWRLLLAAKFTGITVVLILLANPYFIRKTPDRRKFSVLFLFDATGSMSTKDCDGSSRFATMQNEILDPDSSFAKDVLDKHDNRKLYVFAGKNLRAIDRNQEFGILPGGTDIDAALKQASRADMGEHRLGAVVLVTDGVDNEGVSLIDGSMPYRAEGIPIHCIGIGDPRPRADASVTFDDPPPKIVKGRPFQLQAFVRRSGTKAQELTATLYENGRPVLEKQVEFADDENEKLCSFDLTSFVTGMRTYKVVVKPIPDEENLLNNQDFATLTIEPPDIFRVLYFSDSLDWNYKYLKLLAGEQERLQLSARIRLAADTWFSSGIEEKDENGFPSIETINTFDIVVLNLSAVRLLSDSQLKDLIAFVENRGGGLICLGIAENLPAEFEKIIPVKPEKLRVTQLGEAKIEVRPGSFLVSDSIDHRAGLQTGRIYQPAESPMLQLTKEEAKPGAKIPAKIRGTEFITLATQNYGGGKVALLNLAESWKWVLRSDAGSEDYAVFWSRLIGWSATGPRERVVLKPVSSTLPVDVPQEVTVDLLNAEYRPDNHAKTVLKIIAPDGTESEQALYQSPRMDGRYVGKFIPHQRGEYKFTIQAKLSDGEEVEALADYVAMPDTNELKPSPLAERELQSLSRITGGTYWPWEDIDRIRDLPLSSKVTYIEKRVDFRTLWPFLVAIVLFVLPDWILRRRVGLR